MILTQAQIQARLLEIAKAESGAGNDILARLKTFRDALKDTLKLYEEDISDIENLPSELRSQLIEDYDAHLQYGGDPKVHPRITLRRNKKWMYDTKAALEWAQEQGIRDVIRVKESLDKRAMNKLVEEGHYPDAEEVHSVSIIIPKMLGDILIGGNGGEDSE